MPIVFPITNTSSLYYPGTTNLITHSFEDRETTAEFDDALLDQAAWKNARYDGCRLVAKKINQFSFKDGTIDTANTSSGEYEGKYVKNVDNLTVWGGDTSYQNLPLIKNLTTAVYIANTVIGGTEDNQFATIKEHSYVGINKILIINPIDDTVQVLDKSTEPFEAFHRFITNDLHTGARCKLKVLDESISSNLKGNHRVKMNKGYLLKSFTFEGAGESSASAVAGVSYPPVLLENNAMYLYRGQSSLEGGNSLFKDNFLPSSSQTLSDLGATSVDTSIPNQLRFKYGLIEMHVGGANSGTAGQGSTFNMHRVGPSFASASVHENKFTNQYYTGSFNTIVDTPSGTPSNVLLASSGLGSASRFLSIDTLDFLASNSADTTLTEQEKTEVHITFFQGTKDFTKGISSSVSSFDERSIGTFELDSNKAVLDTEQGGVCMAGLPTNFDLVFKGINDNRFLPKIHHYQEDIQSGHLIDVTISGSAGGCIPPNEGLQSTQILTSGSNLDRFEDIRVFYQGGALGPIGYNSTFSGSNGGNNYGSPTNNILTAGKIFAENFYSGSFHYELSFLDKDHTLILDLDKNSELFDGIGNKGLVIVPEFIEPNVSFNLEWYLQKAGILENATNITTNISNDTLPGFND